MLVASISHTVTLATLPPPPEVPVALSGLPSPGLSTLGRGGGWSVVSMYVCVYVRVCVCEGDGSL